MYNIYDINDISDINEQKEAIKELILENKNKVKLNLKGITRLEVIDLFPTVFYGVTNLSYQ